MADRLPPVPYALNAGAPLPSRWRSPLACLTVLGGPHDGWVMVREDGAFTPYCIRLDDLLNKSKVTFHGPFEPIEELEEPRA